MIIFDKNDNEIKMNDRITIVIYFLIKLVEKIDNRLELEKINKKVKK